MHDVPGDAFPSQEGGGHDEVDPDVRVSQAEEDRRIEPTNEFYDGDKDQDKTGDEAA
jgi:histone deacetylase 3